MTESDGMDYRLGPTIARASGAGLGAGLGAFGGPVGAVLGQVTGYAVGELLAWVSTLAYAPLEGPKVRDALEGADEALSQRAGESLRDDGFFTAGPSGSPPAVEFFEGSVRAAARDYERRKAPYLGRFWANLAYEKDIDFARAAFLLRLAEDLTYRQLVLLAIFGTADEAPTRDRLVALNGDSGSERSTVEPECAAEMQDLASRNLLGFLNEELGEVINTYSAMEGRFSELDIARIRPVSAGTQLVQLLSLTAMPALEREHVLAQLGTEV